MLINGVKLTTGQLRYLLDRKFWKHTSDVNLNTGEGCHEAATHAVDLLAEIGYHDYEPTNVPELEVLYRQSGSEDYRPEAPGDKLDESLGALVQYIVGLTVSYEKDQRSTVVNDAFVISYAEHLARKLLERYGKSSLKEEAKDGEG